MSILDELDRVLQLTGNFALKRFGGYHIKRLLDGGKQGKVYLAKNAVEKKFAIKFYKPITESMEELKDRAEKFFREVNMLAKLDHKNIVKINTAGKAIWDITKKKWLIKESLKRQSDVLSENELFFYIMNYIKGQDISKLFPYINGRSGSGSSTNDTPKYEHLYLFEEMIRQISAAMMYYQSEGITHKDIKPKNLIYSKVDNTFIIVDFGFARHLTSAGDSVKFDKMDFMDYPSIDKGQYFKNDMGQFSKVLLKMLDVLKRYYVNEGKYNALKTAIEKGKAEDLSKRYDDMASFYSTVEQYLITKPVWSLYLKSRSFLTPNNSNNFGRFDSKIRIPVTGSIFLTKQIRRIINTSAYQRLRGVKQLGPAMFVFPGATHTRFEHSLGVYYLAARYLEKLIDYSDFRQHCDDIDSSIRLIILSSLLHDIGHYPYSHWIEEIDIFPDGISFPSHESRASGIISSYNIKKIIKSDWGIDYEDISDIIAGDDKNDRFKLFISILNSLIGVDRIDYFMRDSVHCGVRYGEGIDLERLLDALMYVKGKNEICVSEKGRSSLLSILACRNIMYQEIYWHKTVRACDAMFKRFFYEYVKRGLARTEAIEKYFDYTDEKFISKLYNRVDNDKKGRDMIPLIRPFSLGEGERLLYKPGYVYYKSNAANEDRATRRYFKIVLSSNYEKLVSLGNELAKSLKNYLSGINEMDIILEKTPVDKDEKTSPRELKIVYNTRKKDFEEYPVILNDMNSYLENNQQAYIFCNEKYYEDIKRLATNKTLDKILGDLVPK